jgi:signal peptidase II
MIRRVSLWVLVLDQASKYLVSRFCSPELSVPVIPHVLYLTYIHNPGAAFGFFSHLGIWIRIPFFVLITFGAGLVVYAYQRFVPAEKKGLRFALGLIWGGALGNFADRIIRGEVVDFIDFERVTFFNLKCPWLAQLAHNPLALRYPWFQEMVGPGLPVKFPWIFNLADSAITGGLILIFLIYLFDPKRDSY